jgi:hypothetical protein
MGVPLAVPRGGLREAGVKIIAHAGAQAMARRSESGQAPRGTIRLDAVRRAA